MAGTMVGRVLNGRYEITERVGIGGMAEVYRAQDKVLGRMVAVKVMLPQYAADETFTKRFRLEAEAAARLSSPYIVSIYDWGLDDDTYYIVMEFLRGTDMKTAIQERGAINQRKVAEIGSQVAQALSVAHAAGIIHRDIKPQNIMIQPDGNIKVMDFGIARAGDAGLSQTATVLGTAHYVSPEQAQGKELGPASDIYSLGICLYEAATGKLPFEGTDAVSVAVKQVNELPAPPSTVNPNIDPALELIIMKALEKDPSKRFADATEMRHALNDYQAGRPVRVGDVSNMATTVMAGAGAASTTVLPRNGVQDGTTALPRHEQMGGSSITAEPDEKPKDNKRRIIAVVLAVLAIIVIGAGVFALTHHETAEVPDVTNYTVEQAEAALTEAGFEVGDTTEVFNSEVAEGNVVGTDPAAGETADKGSAVNLTISKGSETVSVPSLLGLSASDAQKKLEQAGLKGEQGDDVYSDSYDEGTVAKQSKKEGASVDKGSTITFNLSKGPEEYSIPNVVGMGESSGTSALENAGFKYDVAYDYSDDVEAGVIISQNYTGKAKPGTVITVTVSQGPNNTVEIPNVVGYDLSAAEDALSDAGLNYDIISKSVSDPNQDGIVLSQNKTGTAKEGAVVKITVGVGPEVDEGDEGGEGEGI